MVNEMKKIEEKIGYFFRNQSLLRTALTHSSYANEHRCKSYERMEFLGDSVLSIIISDYLYAQMENVNEGDLSRIRASLVCEETLAKLSQELTLGEYIYLGNGEEKSGSRNRASILSDVFEATLAAIYLDSGMEEAKNFVLGIMKKELAKALENRTAKDYKSRLQEAVQQRDHGRSKIEYCTVSESGPEHKKSFLVELIINGKKVTTGNGHSKKEAEQQAAKKALLGGNNEIL